MSTDKQEDSIDRQKSMVEPYAARQGYTITRVYEDPGIAGDEVARRPQFLRMLKDAQAGLFDLILCDDKQRFGRFDSIDYGEIAAPLRRRGVRLETAKDGPVNWNSLAGRVMDTIQQEFGSEEAKGTSRKVLGQMLQLGLQGGFLGGPAPYGYRLVNDASRIKRHIPDPDAPNGQRPVYEKRLEPDPKTAKVVRLIFDLYGNRGCTLDGICRELYLRGVPGPCKPGKVGPTTAWKKASIRYILRNRKYVGDGTWNRRSEGKYSVLVRDKDGSVKAQARDVKNTRSNRNDMDKWILRPQDHEPLVERELFERVQARLEKQRKRTTPVPNGGDFYLAGLLACGHCGWRMIGGRHKGKDKFYWCGRYHSEGRHACGYNRMMEHKLLDVIVRKIQQEYLDPEKLHALRAEMRRQAEAAAQNSPQQVLDLRRRIAALEADIAVGNRNLTLAPPDAIAGIAQTLRGWREERDGLAAELDRLERGTARADVEQLVDRAEAELWRLRESLHSADPWQVRAVLQELVVKVELWFTYRDTAKQRRATFARGLITLRVQRPDLCRLENVAPRLR
jgi:DNA invertase Pin-like site-specific DNA recombinase